MTELSQEDNGVLRISVEDSSTFNATSNYGKINRLVQDEVVNWVYLCFIKYWIFLSSGMLLLMSCQNDVVAYRIGYMILFLYFITTFQVSVLNLINQIFNKKKLKFKQSYWTRSGGFHFIFFTQWSFFIRCWCCSWFTYFNLKKCKTMCRTIST